MSNEKFKVKFGLAVGDTSATIDGTTGNIVTLGDIDVQGGAITNTLGPIDITSGAAGNITIQPNSTGDIILASDTVYVGDSGVAATITTNGNASLTISNGSGTDNIVIDPSSGTTINDGNLVLGRLNTDTVLTTNGTGDLDIRTGSWPTSANITLNDGANGNIVIDTDGTGQVVVNADVDINGTIYLDQLQVDNININGNTISSTNAFASTGSSISGNTLTIGTLTSGTIAVGQTISGGTTLYAPIITANLSGSGSGSTWTISGPSQTVTSSALNGDGNITLAPTGNGLTIANTRFTSLGGSNLNDTVAIGGSSVNSSGLYPIIASTTQAPVSPTLFIDNTDSGRAGHIVVRDYGQNRAGGTSATAALPVINLEGKRGTATSTGAGTQTASGGIMGTFQFGGFNGTSFVSQTGTGGNPSSLLSLAAEDFVADTASFTGYIGNGVGGASTTLTVTSGTNVHPGLLLSATGILDGTCITAYGTGTGGAGTYTVSRSQALFTSASPGSFTGAGTKNAGSRWLFQYQPQGVKFNTTSRQSIIVQTQTPATTNTVSGVTIPVPPTGTLNFGDGGQSADNILTSSDGNTLYNRIGLVNTNFTNSTLVTSGVTAQDTATVTGYIDNGAGSAGTTLTVSAVSSGILSVGQQVYGTGVTQLTRITAQLTSASAALATTTATGTISTPTITVASATGIAVGQLVIATGVPTNTLVINVVGTTITLSNNLSAGLSATAINFYTAGNTGTYTVSISQLVGSSGSPITIVTGPDNYSLLATNAVQVIGGRQSGLPGRRQPIKNNDVIAQVAFRGVNLKDATGYVLNTNLTSRITAKATEDFSATRGGSRLTFETMSNGGTTLSERISTANDTTVFKSDNYTFESASGTDYLVMNGTSNTFSQPVGFPVYTIAGKPVSGSLGQQICISDSTGNGGRMAYWDGTNSRWNYVSDDAAV